MHQTKWDRICLEKQQQQNVFFYPTKMSKNSKKNSLLQRMKSAFTFKISADSELQNRNEKSYRAQICAGIKSPNTISNFFNPKWVKLGNLLKIPETKLKTKSLVTATGHKENKKNNRVASRKALSLQPYSQAYLLVINMVGVRWLDMMVLMMLTQE